MREAASPRKGRAWYTAIVVVAAGGALAAFIVGNILFGLLILLGAFALMLAGSARSEIEHTYGLSDKGFHAGTKLVTWSNIREFSIKEGAPPCLVVDTATMLGMLTIPLVGIDYRAVRTEFKNNNINEADVLVSPIESICKVLGL